MRGWMRRVFSADSSAGLGTRGTRGKQPDENPRPAPPQHIKTCVGGKYEVLHTKDDLELASMMTRYKRIFRQETNTHTRTNVPNERVGTRHSVGQ